MKIAIIGIGQSLRGDDGAGQAAVRLWQATYPETGDRSNIQIEVVENPGIGLLDLIEGADAAIFVDAVQSGRASGTVYQLKEADLAAFLDGADSAHGWGVAETLALGRKVDPESMPSEITLIGIEVEQVELEQELSPKIKLVLLEVVKLIEETVQNLKGRI